MALYSAQIGRHCCVGVSSQCESPMQIPALAKMQLVEQAPAVVQVQPENALQAPADVLMKLQRSSHMYDDPGTHPMKAAHPGDQSAPHCG